MTLKEFAAACGIPASTVSKALNNYPDISAETKALVLEKSAELGYRPNTLARGLKSGRTWNLGVLYTDDAESGFTHNYFSPVLESFKSEAEKHGYDITFITHHMGNSDMTYLEHCRGRNLDGVCIVNCHFDDPEVIELLNSDLPLVNIDFLYNGRSSVQSRNGEDMGELVRYIVSKGHRRIAYVHGENVPVTEVRLKGFMRAMMECGIDIPEEYLVESVYHIPGEARKGTEKLLSLPNRPTCILMPDDFSALGGMEAIRAAGLRIPEDISIAGYDGVPLLQMCSPRLTTLRQDTASIGKEAAKQLISLIEQPRTTYQEIKTILGQLIPGETVADLT